ncbi:ATP-dependent helicase [Psychrobacter sanguinis]|uniref:ATP-dependent helicase n=1 Tax=Psychrobacter sanguinis TaxID=861445 RepID=UPI00020C7A17|nr:ATP-dependent helicase [Psychrobacter sanguinis]EGK13981.1 ATP-dependent helicase PcrA [Psychrobacter sp. 1501(2011)]MCD9150540.1 ATP-dependent helicase [Psychrobacter sanguinis]
MTDSLFDTQAYNYPMLDDDTRIKIAKLRQSIARLEANLLTPDSVAKNANTDHNFNNNPILEQSSVDYAGELNQSQLLAATTIKGKVLVIAGAGSGKTKTLTYRTSYLIESGASPSSILLLTFTRKAADEIKSRVKGLLAENVADNSASTNLRGLNLNAITSGTFHSFCNMLLRRYSGLLGINPRFTILDTSDSEDAIDLICKEKGFVRKNMKQAFPRKKTLQNLISTSRNRRILLKDLIEKDYPDLTIHIPAIEQLAEEYHRYKRTNHLYDFDDIISQVVSHLKNNLQFRRLIQDTYRHVMVDEYQDTNVPQKQLIDYICEPDNVSLMVVGDDNQSIYAFRGANYENILLFGDSYPDAKLIKLEQNYRSTPAILDYVNALSEQITLGYQKRLFSDLSITGNKPILSRRSNEAEEAKYIASRIIDLKPDLDYNDFAVLSRTSFQSNRIQLEFMERNIPFIVVGGIKFIEKRHIKDILALVKILYNPNDSIAWHRILTLFKGVGEVTATKITQAINSSNDSFEPLLDPKLNKNKEQLIELYEVLIKAGQQTTVADTLDILIEFYLPVLKTVEDNWRERAEDFRVLKNLAQEHSSLDNFLENLALDPPNDSVATLTQPEQKDKDAVTISTIHSAKGLEWPVVFVNALVDGLMPHHRSVAEFEELEEERKLFYVACSRAKTYLYLTAPDYFSSFAGYFDKVSRFISEVSKDTIQVDFTTSLKMSRHKPKSNEPDWW